MNQHANITRPPTLSVASDPRVRGQQELWDRFVGSLQSGPVAVVYHGDLDGAIGGAYLRRALVQHGLSAGTYWISTDEYHFIYLLRWLAKVHPSACVFSDISIENSPQVLRNLVDVVKGPILICDHHYITHDDPLPPNVIVANPTPHLRRGEAHLPTFVLADVIASDAGLLFPDWLAVLAIFAEGVNEFFPVDLMKLGTQAFGTQQAFNRDFYRRSGLQRAATLIRTAFSVEEKEETVLALLDKIMDGRISSFAEFREQLESAFGPLASRIGYETSRMIVEWKSRIARDHAADPIVIIPVDSPYSIVGPVASVLRGTFGDQVIVAYQTRKDFTSVEIRTRNDTSLNLPDILKKVELHVPVINSGGHPSAAGALIRADALGAFLTALSNEISSLRES